MDHDKIDNFMAKARAEAARMDKPQPLYPDYAQFTVVKDLDRHRDGEVGWDLLALLPNQNEVVTEVHDGFGTTRIEPVSVSRTHFLLGRPKEGVVSDLLTRLQYLREAGERLKQESDEADRQRAEAVKDLKETLLREANLKVKLANRDHEVKSIQRDCAQLRDDNKKMQAHLNKLRAHYGQAAIEAVLGEDA